jgi:DNA ligase-associated metallophosphoesterase
VSADAPGTALQVRLAGATVQLDPAGGVVDRATRTGFVADLHLGKSTHFRRRGLAIPEGDEAADLDRLSAFVQRHGLARLSILGDLVHTATGLVAEVEARFTAWRERHPALDVLLVRGNHDRGAGSLPSAWRLRQVNGPLVDGPFVLRHEPPTGPDPESERLTLAGHLHPVVRLGSAWRGDRLRARCFWYRSGVLVLPAFGSFTGGHSVRPERGDRVFVIPPPEGAGPEGPEVVEITP